MDWPDIPNPIEWLTQQVLDPLKDAITGLFNQYIGEAFRAVGQRLNEVLSPILAGFGEAAVIIFSLIGIMLVVVLILARAGWI